jgi:hypothetical protein
MIRKSVSAFGTFSGNTRGEATRVRRTRSPGHGNTRRRQPSNTSRQSAIQPKPCVQPSTVFASSLRPPIQTTSSALKIASSTAE